MICPKCDCSITLQEVYANEGLCPECRQRIREKDKCPQCGAETYDFMGGMGDDGWFCRSCGKTENPLEYAGRLFSKLEAAIVNELMDFLSKPSVMGVCHGTDLQKRIPKYRVKP